MKKRLRRSVVINKYFLLLLIPVVICTSASIYSQQEEEIRGIDSVYRYQGIVPPVEFQYDLSEIFNSPIAKTIPEDILFDDNPSTIWLRTEILTSQTAGKFNGDPGTHFTSTLYEQYLRDSEFDMVRNILGTVQAGAVGYMAYRHIKKYGFWK